MSSLADRVNPRSDESERGVAVGNGLLVREGKVSGPFRAAKLVPPNCRYRSRRLA